MPLNAIQSLAGIRSVGHGAGLIGLGQCFGHSADGDWDGLGQDASSQAASVLPAVVQAAPAVVATVAALAGKRPPEDVVQARIAEAVAAERVRAQRELFFNRLAFAGLGAVAGFFLSGLARK